ncbi:unnamed protein product [Prunus armeniaca]|uniref:Retrotransposon gag domain-containing protein n=1 Tax=Prunus armeniaca TaxID=36596 RepID=A0A6J5WSJ7_PRUAR|nr:unnamed protein product [Prunus armeniaca]CAB4303035.1 unnamed protein product [Prunus armeniaca]
MSTPRSGSARSNAQDGEPSLAVIQLREIMKELRETRKVAEKALENVQNTACRGGSKEGKRKQRHEISEGDSSNITHSSVRDRATAEDQDGDLDLHKMVKKAKDTDLHSQIEKIVRGYKPQTLVELALEAAKGICKSSFKEDILNAKKPVKFTQPKFKLFEGTTNPIEHIYHFQQQMVLEGDDEALLCKLFPSSLSGSALIWFRQLKPRSIGGFTQLCEMFISQYICNQKRRKDVTILFSTKQSTGESLKDYLRRFTEEMSTLEECDSHNASLAFREGVIPGIKMHRSLVKTPPMDMREVMARADGVIRLEEEELTQSKRATSTIAVPKPPPEQKVETRRYPSRQESSNRPKQSRPFTKLTVSLAKLFHENKGKGIFRTPPAICKSPEKRDRNKMCTHHNDFGHTTNEC